MAFPRLIGAAAIAVAGAFLLASPGGGGGEPAASAGADARAAKLGAARAATATRGAEPRFEGRRVVFGRSVEGRPLVARRIGNAAAKRTVLVVGEIHGDEEAGRRIVKDFRRRHRRFEAAEVWTVAGVNPDGHAADTRGNAHGVDLNRNFSVGWSAAEPPSSGYYGGPEPFSEPEARALRRLLKRIDPDLTVWYHQPWGAVLAPCSGDAAPERRYARISRLLLDRCRGENLPGTATRWQERRGGAAFVVELGSHDPSAADRRRHVSALAAVFGKGQEL